MKTDSSQIKLREFLNDDIAEIATLANNKKIFENVRDSMPHPYYRNNAIDFVEMCRKENPQLTFAIEFDGHFAGCIGLVLQSDIYRLSAEIGYWIGEPYWGKGIATEAVKLASKYAFNILGLVRLFAGVFEHNMASCRVLEKGGFKKECLSENAVIKNNRIQNEYRFFLLKEWNNI